MLAGISAEYYLRLEQGRDRNPSLGVLEAIARVLEVDQSHLQDLASYRPGRARRRPKRQTVPDSTFRLVASLAFPAFIEGRYLDVLAANDLATAMSPRLRVGGNRLRDLFSDPEEQALFTDWRRAAAALVSGFRQSVGTEIDNPRVIELVGELSLNNSYFRQVWARHDVAPRAGAALTIHHPLVGDLRLDREKLSIAGTDGCMLVIFHPEPGTDSADKLTLLASTSTTSCPTPRPNKSLPSAKGDCANDGAFGLPR